MDNQTLRQFLQQQEATGIAQLHAKGYAWFKSEWMPRLRLADELLGQDLELIADCWYLVGDVHDFNGAPLQAIHAYQQALHYDEDVDGAYRELAYLHELIGQYPNALDYVREALQRLPDEEPESEELLELRTDLMDLEASIQDSLNYAVEPYLTPQNKAWLLGEQLAQEEFEDVVTRVGSQPQPTPAVLQRLAQAQGALNDTEACWATWQQLATQPEALEIGYADWFYLPAALAERPAFWKLLWQLAPQVTALELNQHESLESAYGEDLEASELLRLVADYHLATLEADHTILDGLKQQYPLWEDVQR